MNHDDGMLEETIAALSSALQAMQQRLKDVQSRLDEVKQQRTQVLRSEAERMLPGFSMRVLAELERELPGFVTTSVRTAFSQNRKTFGLFKPAGYDSALTAIRTRLAGFIEQTRRNALTQYDEEIAALERERDRLDLRLYETTQNLTAMTAVLDRKGRLPPAARAGLAKILERSRLANDLGRGVSGRNPHATGVPRTPDHRHADQELAASSGNDMWYYTLTDILPSFHACMLDTASQNPLPDTVVCRPEHEIATDDRLGAFS